MIDVSQIAAFATPVHLFLLLAGALVLVNLVLRAANRRRAQFACNAAILLLLTITAGAMAYANTQQTVLGVLSVNPFSTFFILILTFSMLLVSVLAYEYAGGFGDFALMASFALMGMYLVSLSVTLITLFLGLELMVIPTVFIVLLSRKSLEAATKLFIIGSISVGVLSFAIVALYGGTNSLSLQPVYQESGILAFAMVLFIASLGIEASVFPFNVLMPDVYEGSPAYATAMLGGINKKVGFIALMQVLIMVFIAFRSAFLIIAILSVATMFYGNIAAIMQRNIKRMLAYSSISQAGYILIGIASSSSAGISAALFQIFAHMFLFIGLLAIVAWLESKNRTEINDIIGLNGENRVAAFCMTIFMLSLVGLPFTTGFVGKFLLFLGAVNSGLVWLAVLGVMNSIISVYYYARPIMAAYAQKAGSARMRMNTGTVLVVVTCLVITIAVGMYPQPLIHVVGNASSYLFRIA